MNKYQLVNTNNHMELIEKLKTSIAVKEINQQLNIYRYTSYHLSIMLSHLLAIHFNNNTKEAVSFLKVYDNLVLQFGKELEE